DLVECAAAVVAGAELVALGVVETGEGELVAFVGGEASGVEGAAWQQRDPAPAAAPDQDREPRVLEPAQVAHHGAGGDADLSGQLGDGPVLARLEREQQGEEAIRGHVCRRFQESGQDRSSMNRILVRSPSTRTKENIT